MTYNLPKKLRNSLAIATAALSLYASPCSAQEDYNLDEESRPIATELMSLAGLAAITFASFELMNRNKNTIN